MGDGVRLPGARWFLPKLRAAAPWTTDTNTMGVRYLCGIKLNAKGLTFWTRQNTDANQRGHGSRGSASAVEYVNKMRSTDDDDR